MQFEPYQYWTFAGFIFLFAEFLTLKVLPLTIAGAAFFAAVAAYKYPDFYPIQVLSFTIFLPVVYTALRPYLKNETRQKIGQKSEQGSENERK